MFLAFILDSEMFRQMFTTQSSLVQTLVSSWRKTSGGIIQEVIRRLHNHHHFHKPNLILIIQL